MKRIFAVAAWVTACVLVLFLAVPVRAADLYHGGMKDGALAPVSSSWTGFYVGGNVGYGWDSSTSLGALQNLGGLKYVFNGRAQPSGWLAGFGGGFNFEPGTTIGFPNSVSIKPVIGVEVDTSLTDIADTSRTTITVTQGGLSPTKTIGTVASHVDWLATIRARAGVLAFSDTTFLYGTGGLAFGGVSNDATSALAQAGGNETRVGYVVGGGIEYKVSPTWSFKTEYLYFDLGDSKVNGSLDDSPTGTKVNNRFNVIRTGVNFKIGADLLPLN